jgi:DNA end-binding protein Ku
VTSLRQQDQIADEKKLFGAIDTAKPEKDMIDIAAKIIAQKIGKFDPKDFRDHYETALRDLIKAKSRGAVRVAEPEPDEDRKVVDLMSALKASLKGQAGKTARRADAGGDNVVPLRRPADTKEKTRTPKKAPRRRGRRG